ncbi:MAG: methylenetetrahydrofolate--tRNA-(uracil(54)-C(5))-methyltransferase (FADH(2)-oxidizing) TrmFO [Vampirovibrionales bacterium]|nr:methylenetetrahydrofolate--tRNA-(uracil(54)-C(5))-methyltransferase (FADH(2)-oxidizing) TrmFO [Vampirovibrionales bacterium]
MHTTLPIQIIGAGLAGSEAALQLAHHGIPVSLYDIKPQRRSPAHHRSQFAEIVCSNSMGALGLHNASGLLKSEMRQLNSHLLAIAEAVSVPAGRALAVDREAFSDRVTAALTSHPLITLVEQDVAHIPEDALTIIATGPLTTPALAEALCRLMGQHQLFFFDAASPIVTKESINFERAFFQNRYGLEHGEEAGSYINCPLNQAQYKALVAFLNNAEKAPLKDFEQQPADNSNATKTAYFESCLPVEVIASRGENTLCFGPMKPVGLIDPHTGEQPYAVVQLRQDNALATLYNLVGFQTNLKWGEQKTMMTLIPGLEQAEIVRYGVMHRNTYLPSPDVLLPTLQLKANPNTLIAGQLTGTEGYSESIATGLFAALNAVRLYQHQSAITLPETTMLGALLAYITRPEASGKGKFQPINANWGILPPLPAPRPRKKAEKAERHAQRAVDALQAWQAQRSP